MRRNRWVSALALLVALAVLQWGQTTLRGPGRDIPANGVSGHPRLVDGDSFFLGGDEVRLVGLDAPEGRQTCLRANTTWPCGEESRRQLARLVGGQAILCRSTERDQHGRLLAVCSRGNVDLNREMVASGFAVAYGNYEREEASARSAKAGLWSGEFQRPRQWRRENGHGRE